MNPQHGGRKLAFRKILLFGLVVGIVAVGPVSGSVAACTPGSCNDNDPCTVDTCDPVAGCIFTPTNCDDGNVCTVDSCAPVAGPSQVATLLIGHDTSQLEREYQKIGSFVQIWGTSTHVTGAAIDANGVVYVCIPNYVQNGGNVIERRGPGNTNLGTINPAVGGQWIEDLGNYTTGFILASTDTGSIFRINTTNGSDTLLFATGHSLPGVTWDGTNIWTTGGTSTNLVYRRNLAGTVLSSFNTGLINGGIGYDPDDGTLWIGHPAGQVTHHSQAGALLGGFDSLAGGQYIDGLELGYLWVQAGCQHPALACNDNDYCTIDACDPMTGCFHPPHDCNDNNPCTDDACSSLTGCVYTNNNASCEDNNNLCTNGDTCVGGLCQPGAPVDCNDNNVCTTDSCDPRFGCGYVNNTNFCNDGDACTIEDMCIGGTCQPGIPVVCNDNNACTTDSCIPPMGCVYTSQPNGSACDDGNACTSGEVCVNGTCQLGVGVTCVPSDQCHVAGICNPGTGVCSNPPAPNGTACNDGNPCTAGEVCMGGVCAGSTVIAVPAETKNLAAAANKTTYSWSPASDATSYDAVRGNLEALPVGSSAGGEVCFENLSSPSLVDTAIPAPRAGFWYLSRARNPCGPGPWGTQSNGTVRVTTTCP